MDQLSRETFQQNRSLEFFSEKELSMQIGHDRRTWPIAIAKELIDNSLDACEAAGVLPDIHITADDEMLTVSDNGPGIPEKVIEQSLDYLFRVSDKNFYVSPSRGQLGNALKCLYAVPFILDGTAGRVDIETGGILHTIEITVDQIAQEPRLTHMTGPSLVKNGTSVKVYVKGIAGLLEEYPHGYSYQRGMFGLLTSYRAVNPHMSFTYRGGFNMDMPRTSEQCDKWTPSNPTSAHWYDTERLASLIGAYLSNERNNGHKRTVRDFVGEFKGLSSTVKRKKVTEAVNLSRAYLADLVVEDSLDKARIAGLRHAMQDNSVPVKATALGVIGEDHLRQWMSETFQSGDSFRYKRVTGDLGGLPYVLEVCFGMLGGDMAEWMVTTYGLNFSPALSPPWDIHSMLYNTMVQSRDPVSVFVHLACPRLDYTDRGKTRLTLPPDIQNNLKDALRYVSSDWTKLKRKEIKQDRQLDKEREKIAQARKRAKLSVKDAAFEVMEKAYLKASADNTLPANARQIMYAARPWVIELTGGDHWKNSSYFTQTLLPDYQKLNPKQTENWDVVYDARGTLIEPHTRKVVPIGTLAVRRYIDKWSFGGITDKVDWSVNANISTIGPKNRYSHALFCEKEGFNELFKSVHLAEVYDTAIMSTKGMSVTAMRALVAEMSRKGATVLVLHDFDKSGFSIFHTLRADTRRWSYDVEPRVVDLGFRLADVNGLETEEVHYNTDVDPRINLIESGATQAEAKFLRSSGHPENWKGQRVELNAMTSKQLVEWLEKKFKEHGVKKVVPDEETLKNAYIGALKAEKIRKEVKKIVQEFDQEFEPPENLHAMIAEKIAGSSLSWDSALETIAFKNAN